ncbi:Ppfia2, partial [Symbiodinium sp. CCMP2456]
MPPQSQVTYLYDLTEVPAGWPLETVIDTFVHLAAYTNHGRADRARDAVSRRLVELWASRPEEAQAWLMKWERFAKGQLSQALLRHGAAERGKYGKTTWRFSEAGLLRGEPGDSAEEHEHHAAWYLQQPHIHARCRELAERLEAADGPEMNSKRQKLEEETSLRRRLEAELQKSQEEGRQVSNRLAAAEVQVSSKATELQAAQSESAKCKEQCEELANRTAAAESAAAEMRQQLRQLQEKHSKCQERCEELLARLEAEAVEHASSQERLSQAESDAAGKEVELRRLQEESRGFRERCQLAEARFAEAGSQAELQLENAVLQKQLEKAEAERAGMLGQLLDVREERGMYKERIRQLEHQLCAKKQVQGSHQLSGARSGHTLHCEAPVDEASNNQEPDLAEQLGDDDGTASSVLSHSSWFSLKPDSMKPQCFMVDAIFKTRSFGADFFLMGRDLKKGSQVVAGDDAAILEVAKKPEICDASEVVELQAGIATLRVTPDHLVQVADAKGEVEESLYVEAGKLKAGDLVMLDSGEGLAMPLVKGDAAALTSVTIRPLACQVMKIVFEPYLP